MDEECAVCCHLKTAQSELAVIASLIEYSCSGQKKKQDFGLDKSFIMKEVSTIQQMIKYHNFWHVNGSALNDSESVIDFMSDNPKPKRFRDSK